MRIADRTSMKMMDIAEAAGWEISEIHMRYVILVKNDEHLLIPIYKGRKLLSKPKWNELWRKVHA